MDKRYISYNKRYICVIYWVMAFGLLISFLFTKGEYFNSIDGLSEDIFFEDFFAGIQSGNKINASSFGAAPFTLLIYYIIGLFIPRELLLKPIEELKFIQQANFVCVFFLCFSFLLFVSVIIFRNSQEIAYNAQIIVCSIVSIPYLFVFRSGGLEFLALTFFALYLQNCDAESKRRNNAAYICMGIACSINFYLFIFLLLINNRKNRRLVYGTFVVLSVLSGLIVREKVIYFEYLQLLTAKLKIWPYLLLFIIIVFILIKYSETLKQFEKLYLILFALGFLFGENFNGVYAYFVFGFLAVGIFPVETKKELIFKIICETIAFLAISPLPLNLFKRTSCCLLGAVILLFFIVYEKIIKAHKFVTAS